VKWVNYIYRCHASVANLITIKNINQLERFCLSQFAFCEAEVLGSQCAAFPNPV